MAQKHFFDLTTRAPRSARVRIGGYVILARMLDKGRAFLEKKNGSYNFDCPLDKRFLDFVGVSGSQIAELLGQQKSDGEILTWIQHNAPKKHSEQEIAAWSAFQEGRVPSDVEMRTYFNNLHQSCAPQRTDIVTWFDLLDVDDFVSFGGCA